MMCQPFSGCINKEQKNMYMLYYNLYFFLIIMIIIIKL